jgi:hypothetical protein
MIFLLAENEIHREAGIKFRSGVDLVYLFFCEKDTESSDVSFEVLNLALPDDRENVRRLV